MKNKSLLHKLICLTALGTVAQMALALSMASQMAFAGVKEGGGGAQIEAQFRLLGYELIARIANNPLADALCPSQLLESTLDTTQIDVVPMLLNPATGEPIPGLLDAWTVPHQIQLLQDSWQNLVGVHVFPFRVAQQVDVLILHELYRATGQCDDDRFVKSVRAYAILSQIARTTFSEKWEFKYRYYFASSPEGAFSEAPSTGPAYFGGPVVYNYSAACDQPSDAIQVGSTMNCFTSGTILYKNFRITEVHAEKPGGPRSYTFEPTLEQVEGVQNLLGATADLSNQLKMVSPEHPALLVHDIQHGVWSFMMQ